MNLNSLTSTLNVFNLFGGSIEDLFLNSAENTACGSVLTFYQTVILRVSVNPPYLYFLIYKRKKSVTCRILELENT